jgi:hypothetical protein
MAGRPRKYSSDAEKQAAFRNRQRVTKCPLCEGSNVLPMTEDIARGFGVYAGCLCFDCNGLVSDVGRVWQLITVPGRDLPEWVMVRDQDEL